MKRVGIIENLINIAEFRDGGALDCTAEKYSDAVGGNTGNLAFVLGTYRAIGNPKVRIAWGMHPDELRRAKVEHIVICCANQIGQHADLAGWADRLSAFDLPVTLVGLGAQTPNYEKEIQVPEGTIRFLDVVGKLNKSNRSNIGVRGAYSQQVLASLGYQSEISGCPSLFISSNPQLGQTIVQQKINRENPRLAVAAGNPYHGASAKLEAQLVDIVNQTHGAYVVQHPNILIALAIGALSEKDHKAIPAILGAYGNRLNESTIQSWFRRNAYAFYDGVAWMDFLAHFDGVAGPRFHGVALGVQAGKPGVVVHIDNRTKELSSTSGIKSVSVEDFRNKSVPEILDLLRWTPEEGRVFDNNRVTRARSFANFISDNQLEASKQLVNLFKASVTQRTAVVEPA